MLEFILVFGAGVAVGAAFSKMWIALWDKAKGWFAGLGK